MENIITEFELFYSEIINFYKSKKSAIDRWTDIAKYMHQKSIIVNKVYNNLILDDVRLEIKLDYEISINQLQAQIISENNKLVKCSLIVLALHHIIYDLMSTKGNYYFSLNGDEEMQILKKKIIYYINVSIKPEQNVYFHAYILLVALESIFNGKFYLGIDFEYTQKKIQLAQLNFEHNVSLQSMIMIISPSELLQTMTDDFVNLIICSKYIKKIFHGADSLDIPYMYTYMLQDDPEKIIKSTATIIDTRFLCEYYKLSRTEVSDNKCSIYDSDSSRSAIYYFKVVSDEQQAKLSSLLESMPHPLDIVWRISHLPKSQVLYAQYDVLFLKYFYYRMIFMATEDETSEVGKKSVMILYKHVLNEITRFVFLERNNVTYLMAKCKDEVNPLNNYFIRKQSSIVKMIDIFNQLSVNLESTDPKVSIDKLIKVNHFKDPVMTIVKRMIYGFISQKCRIQKDKTTIWTDRLDNQFIFDLLKEMEFYYLLNMFKDLSKTLENRVIDICKN